MNIKNTVTKGTVPLMILEILRSGEAYGYEIVKEIAQRSGGQLEFGQGTVYPLLYKLQDKKYVSSHRKPTESGKERRYYRITDKGLKFLERSKASWLETNQAVGRVLGLDPTAILSPLSS